jgi:hypothetical protein
VRATLLGLALSAIVSGGELRAQARLDITGAVESSSEERLEVRVGLVNRGSEAVRKVQVHGRLFGAFAEATLAADIAPGASRDTLLSFPAGGATPGVHAATLMLDYEAGPASSAATYTQPAWVLIALGGQADPPVRISVEEGRLDVAGRMPIALESADGAPHQITLSVFAPRGLRARPPESVVSVPAQGRLSVPILLFRVDAPWESTQGLLVVAEDASGPLTRTAVVAASARVGREPGRLPGLYRVLVGAALVLLGGAVLLELRRRPAAAT